YFDFAIGAFGSDHRDRNSLVPVALAKLATRSGQGLAPAEVTVVGDTPRDVACARAGGARAVAVASGPYSIAELMAEDPDAALVDLLDADAVIAAILDD